LVLELAQELVRELVQVEEMVLGLEVVIPLAMVPVIPLAMVPVIPLVCLLPLVRLLPLVLVLHHLPYSVRQFLLLFYCLLG
jgi:hypothetical protein